MRAGIDQTTFIAQGEHLFSTDGTVEEGTRSRTHRTNHHMHRIAIFLFHLNSPYDAYFRIATRTQFVTVKKSSKEILTLSVDSIYICLPKKDCAWHEVDNKKPSTKPWFEGFLRQWARRAARMLSTSCQAQT